MKVIGYTDDNGYLYCPKHASPQMNSATDDELGICEICGIDVGRESVEYWEKELKQYDGV